MKRPVLVFALVLVFVASLAPARAAPSFTLVKAFATKTGFRGIVAWQASEPVAGRVEWGTSAASLTNIALPVADVADRAQMSILEGLPLGSTIYYKVVDTISGVATDVQSFTAANAYNAYSATTKYTINLLVALDSPSAPDSVPFDASVNNIAAGINIVAERLYDAMDGYARIGSVIVTDTLLNYPVNTPARGTLCRNAGGVPAGGTTADMLVQTSVPFDSHTWAGWMISTSCTGLYVGRLGWLVVPWVNDLDFGYTLTHELMHYAFNAPDLYVSGANCNNATWDGSIMHNSGGYSSGRWRLTELDRSAALTPCAHGSAPWSWDVLRERYEQIPAATAPQGVVNTAARGNADGGGLEIYTLHQGAGGTSTLARYAPSDS